MADQPQAHHQLHVSGERGALRLHVALELRAPWTVIFGPSGSGKSSLLRAACGLLPKLNTRLQRRENDAWIDIATLPPHQRQIAYAPQGAALFPHLSVRQNIAFAAQNHGKSRRTHDSALIHPAVKLFVLTSMLERMPRALSGGERQRVNLARAVAVPDTKLMLLDEPFNGIDRRMRDDLLLRLRERMETLGVPVVSVTHDVEEALLLEAEVVRLDAGRIVGRGSAALVLTEERARMKRVLELKN